MTSNHQDEQFPKQKSSRNQLMSFLSESSPSRTAYKNKNTNTNKYMNGHGSLSANQNGSGKHGILGNGQKVTINVNGSSSSLSNTNRAPGSGPGYSMTIKPLSPSARKIARAKAQAEAEAVFAAPGTGADTRRRLENFNLLGVVTSPKILEDMTDSSSSNMAGIGGSGNGIGGGIGSGSGSGSGSGRGDIPQTSSGVGNAAGVGVGRSINSIRENAGSPTAGSGSTSASSAFFNSMSTSISKEIESLNTTLSTYSKTYLVNYGYGSEHPSLDYQTELGYAHAQGSGYGYGYGYGYDSIPKGQIPMEDLPKELLDIDLTSVEAYLRKCGALAEQLNLRHGEEGNVEDDDVDVSGRIDLGESYDDSGNADEDLNENDSDVDVDADTAGVDVDVNEKPRKMSELDSLDQILGTKLSLDEIEDPTASVPNIFFSPYFDLTDPKTFESLLVLDDNEIDESGHGNFNLSMDGNGDDNANADADVDAANISSSHDDPIIRIQTPEKLTQHLDTIELALLNQVRSKSSSFFRETNRFSYLKSLVSESVQEVESLRSQLDTIRERSINDAELIPIMDRQRNDTKLLGEVLDEILEVVEVKSSVGGLIASGDYLGAVDAIQLARRLLNGDTSNGNGSTSSSDSNKTGNSNGHANGSELENGESRKVQKKERHILRKITALNKINDQLTQYEDLVIMDLSNGLVESFLSWNGRSNGEMLGSNSLTGIGSSQGAKVKHTILAMKKCGKLSTMADIYREKLCDTIHVTIRTTITECAADAAKDASLIPSASATIVSIPTKSNSRKESKDDSSPAKSSIIEGVTMMSFDEFMECLDMIYEHTLSLLKSAAGVNKFCLEEGISFKDDSDTNTENGGHFKKANINSSSSPSALIAGADLSHRSISDILRLRKDTHSLITFDEMKRLWDSCISFTLQLERISGQKAYVLRSTLLAQAKAFVERKHEANMSSLAAALDSERWTQCDVSAERQTILDRLCSGRAVLSTRDKKAFGNEQSGKSQVAIVEGKRYRVVWSCLLLIEMIMSNVACAAHFQTLATNVVGKVSELLRLFNSRATQLVLGAGAIHSSARLKSINAKHLALVTQCVGVVQSILPHVRAALMAQLPSRQEPLLAELDKIKKEYAEHHDKVLDKFVSIIGGIVEHSLISRIKKTDFNERSKIEETADIQCCSFLDGVITNTRKMHQVLVSLLPLEDLIDVFSRIFAHLDSTIPKIFLAQDSKTEILFSMPDTLEGKRRLILEVETMAHNLNNLPSVKSWDFGAMMFLSRRLEINEAENEADPVEDIHHADEPVPVEDIRHADEPVPVEDIHHADEPVPVEEQPETTNSMYLEETLSQEAGEDEIDEHKIISAGDEDSPAREHETNLKNVIDSEEEIIKRSGPA